MGKFLLLAFRNVFRNRRRTVMTLLMVGGGVAGLLLVGGFFAFMMRGLREGTIRNGLGHIQIFTAEHFRRDEVHVLDTGISNWRQVASAVQLRGPRARRCPPHRVLRHAFERREVLGIHGQRRRSRRRERVMGFSPRLSSGRDLTANSNGEVEALIGTGVARSMSVKVGDGLTILAVTADGALNGIDVQIVGIVNTGIQRSRRSLSAHHTSVGPAPARRATASRNLVVGLDSTDNTDKVAAGFGPRLQGLSQQMELQEVDRSRRLLQAGPHALQRHLPLPRHHRLLHGAHGQRQYAADGHDGAHPRDRHHAGHGHAAHDGSSPSSWSRPRSSASWALSSASRAAIFSASLLNASGLHLPPPPGYHRRHAVQGAPRAQR